MVGGDKKTIAGVVVGLAAGGVYMTGPLAFPGVQIEIWQGFFWLMVATLGTSGLYFVLINTIREDRAMPISFMVVGTVLFFAGAVWLGIINERSKQPSQNNVKTTTPFQPDVVLVAEPGRLTLYNRSGEDFLLWGDQLEGGPADMEPRAARVPKDAFYYFLTDRLESFARSLIGSDGDRLLSFDIYLSRSQDEHYTLRCRLLLKMDGGKFSVHAQNLGIENGGW